MGELVWTRRNGDASASVGDHSYEIEEGSGKTYWAFYNGSPLGIYDKFRSALQRCESHFLDNTEPNGADQ